MRWVLGHVFGNVQLTDALLSRALALYDWRGPARCPIILVTFEAIFRPHISARRPVGSAERYRHG